MGKVYAATLTSEAAGLAPGTLMALKVVHPHLLEVEGFFQRFLREADIGDSVRHDNVARTYAAGALAGHHFLVMEHVEGQTLAELRAELGTLPEELCRHVARELCKGLSAIHAAGVVHRDMKPENVLITADHVVKVMDLGVARLVDEQMRLSQSGAFTDSQASAAARAAEFSGAPLHAARERVARRPATRLHARRPSPPAVPRRAQDVMVVTTTATCRRNSPCPPPPECLNSDNADRGGGW